MNTINRGVYEVSSAGRSLVVDADPTLERRWESIAPHLPGVLPAGLRAGAGPVTVQLPAGAADGDARRVLNAHLHLLHLSHSTLCVHAVALQHPGDGRVAVLLGGHGAGKTLAALALARRGWRVLAGDVALVECSSPGGQPRVLGGTAAFLARRGPTRRWFPDLELAAAGPDRVDLSLLPGLREPLPLDLGAGGVSGVSVAAVVDVDGDPAAGTGTVEVLDTHTAATVWWRASGHLLERLLDNRAVVLRQLEDAAAASHRLERVQNLAGVIRLHAVWGAPEMIADRIEDLARTGTPAQTAEVD
ncbi:hypothetical protein ABZ896_12670 [Streptomyces sp. NPDC047072]|uniref:hypothetical protein n=1 Tax=Streptomyces sp. NPDC047072 TaxID=3154809 RepID=UPI0033C3B694